jgi:hypothetical protein
MTEVEVNGMGKVGLDTAATKIALASASTSIRLGSLHALEERLSNNGRMLYSNVLPFTYVLMFAWRQK